MAASWTPTLSVEAIWGLNIDKSFTGESWNSDNFSDYLSLRFTLNIPLDGYIPRSAKNNTIKEMEDSLNKTDNTMQRTIYGAEKEIRVLVMELDTAKSKMDLYRNTIKVAERNYQMAEEGYRQGSMELLDVEDSYYELLSARQNYLASQYEYETTLIDLEYALNTDMEELKTQGDK